MKYSKKNNIAGLIQSVCSQLNMKYYRPKRLDTTRWSGMYITLRRYFDVELVFRHPMLCDQFKNFLLLPGRQWNSVKSFFEAMKDFEGTSKELQASACTVARAKELFRSTLMIYGEKFPHLRDYLEEDPNNYFVNGKSN